MNEMAPFWRIKRPLKKNGKILYCDVRRFHRKRQLKRDQSEIFNFCTTPTTTIVSSPSIPSLHAFLPKNLCCFCEDSFYRWSWLSLPCSTFTVANNGSASYQSFCALVAIASCSAFQARGYHVTVILFGVSNKNFASWIMSMPLAFLCES